jgi:16S rRNA (adenine1518-N6/adenine1519-N6)-dimethyltransferase
MTDLPKTKKSLGQHWLTDLATLTAICDAAEITTEDTVLEIGPGTGTLTRELVKRAREVVAVEFDKNLADQLTYSQIATNLQIIREDILKFDLTSMSAGYKVVANIPYYLTSNLVRTLSESTNPPAKAVLLVQKEVAQRIAAKAGDMSLLSISAQFYWQVSLGSVVPAQLFTPPPKVDSQIVILDRQTEPLFIETDTKKFFQLVKAGFASRRKTLLNSLAGGLRKEKAETQTILQTAGIDPGLRAQNLSLDEWHRLYQVINK